MSIFDIDRAALASAKRLQASQPQAKFLGNIAQAAAPILGTAAMLFPHTAILGGLLKGGIGLGKLATGAGMLGNMFGGGGGGGGGQPQGGVLSQLAGAVGPAIATNALARGDWKIAEQIRNDAAARMGGATKDSLNAFQNMLAQYRDPALSGMNNNPYLLNPNQNMQMQAPMVGNVLGSRYGQVPGMQQPQAQQQGGQQQLMALLGPLLASLLGANGSPFGGSQAPMSGAPPQSQPPIIGNQAGILGDGSQFQQLAAQFNNQFAAPGMQQQIPAPAPPVPTAAAAPTPQAQAPAAPTPMAPYDQQTPFRRMLPRFQRMLADDGSGVSPDVYGGSMRGMMA